MTAKSINATWPHSEAQEATMSADFLNIFIAITVGIIVITLAWTPFVRIVYRPGLRSMGGTEKKERQTLPYVLPSIHPPRPAPMSSLSSRRLAAQSRDLLNEISARGYSEAAIPRVSPISESTLTQKESIKNCAE
jgi:hypothetical protein